jgi:hypothetical protein
VEADLPLKLVSGETPPPQIPGHPEKKERGRDECFEFLVAMTGATLDTVTKGMRGEINTALRDIRAVMPEVTAKDMQKRADAYREKWPKVTCSPSALAKHWGSLEASMKKESGGGVGNEPLWDWERLAAEQLEMNICMGWDTLLERMREMILSCYANLSHEEKGGYAR